MRIPYGRSILSWIPGPLKFLYSIRRLRASSIPPIFLCRLGHLMLWYAMICIYFAIYMSHPILAVFKVRSLKCHTGGPFGHGMPGSSGLCQTKLQLALWRVSACGWMSRVIGKDGEVPCKVLQKFCVNRTCFVNGMSYQYTILSSVWHIQYEVFTKGSLWTSITSGKPWSPMIV